VIFLTVQTAATFLQQDAQQVQHPLVAADHAALLHVQLTEATTLKLKLLHHTAAAAKVQLLQAEAQTATAAQAQMAALTLKEHQHNQLLQQNLLLQLRLLLNL
jgi:hypothetical protein